MPTTKLMIGAAGGDSCGMSETDKTSQNDAQATVMAYRSPHGKRPPRAEISHHLLIK